MRSEDPEAASSCGAEAPALSRQPPHPGQLRAPSQLLSELHSPSKALLQDEPHALPTDLTLFSFMLHCSFNKDMNHAEERRSSAGAQKRTQQCLSAAAGREALGREAGELSVTTLSQRPPHPPLAHSHRPHSLPLP